MIRRGISPTSGKIGRAVRNLKQYALIIGPLVAIAVYFLLPDSYVNPTGETVALLHPAKACCAVVVLMGIFWFTETIPIAATAIIPIAVFPVLGVASLKDTCIPYGSSTIFLFLGGFLLAAGIQRWNLDRRLALYTINMMGTKPQQISAGLMIATAMLAMWVSNTATAAMMVPIVSAILHLFRTECHGSRHTNRQEHNFAICMLLCVAYGASIGGMGTILGSPPNGIFVRFMEHTYNHFISVFDWMKLGIPIMLILLAVTWIVLNKILYRDQIDEIPGGKMWIQNEIKKLGPMSRGEKFVLGIFLFTVLLWISNPYLRMITLDGGVKPFAGLSDASIAITGGLLLFLMPLNGKFNQRTLTWDQCRQLPLGLLLLFGGGLSMAAAISKTGLDGLISAQATALAGMPGFIVILGITALVVFATEITSNTALAATMMPLLSVAAAPIGMQAEVLLLATTFGCSAAFMMPVATPPNAIVFSTGHIRISEMIKAGFWLNLISIIVISVVCWFGSGVLFG